MRRCAACCIGGRMKREFFPAPKSCEWNDKGRFFFDLEEKSSVVLPVILQGHRFPPSCE